MSSVVDCILYYFFVLVVCTCGHVCLDENSNNCLVCFEIGTTFVPDDLICSIALYCTAVNHHCRITRESGTSASAPVFAAMITQWNDMRIAAGRPPMGFIAPFLYAVHDAHPSAFQDITTGDNVCCSVCLLACLFVSCLFACLFACFMSFCYMLILFLLLFMYD